MSAPAPARRPSKPPRRPALLVEALEDRTVPTLLGNQLFPADYSWNQNLANAPVAATSATIMNSILTTYGNGQFHPDFGQDYRTGVDLYGIPYNVVHGNATPRTGVVIDAYASESDVVPAPIPAGAVLEGDFQNGPKFGVDARGDSHLLVYDVDNNVAYEFYRASRPSENADGRWHADQATIWNMKADSFRTLGWTSADAAGLSILAGLARPDEGLPVNQGGQGVITHAIRMTLQNSVILDQFLYPASHVANSGNDPAIQPPMGARFRLKASVDISRLSPEARIIAQAMKDYGLIVADNGSNFFISGASYAVNGNNQLSQTWDDNDIQDTVHGLKSLRFSDFEVVDLTPVVTGLSASGGPAGTSVTVLGQNFSGAAGHLQVFFGGTPAAAVTVVDDAHVVAVAPAGSGTVDVRVQSGVSTAPDPENVENTIFGYGISAVSANDRFTYGGAVLPPVGGTPPPGGSTPPGGTGGGPFAATVGVVDPSSGWYLRNTNTSGGPDVAPFAYGAAAWVPLAGDWNGDGKTTVGVFDLATATWYLKNNSTAGAPDVAAFRYGAPGWIPVVGDWDGNGTGTIGVVDPVTMTWYLRNSNQPGAPDIAPFRYGASGWTPVAGDWDGNGKTSIGVVDSQGRWYLRNSNTAGAPDVAPFRYGGARWRPVVGDWDFPALPEHSADGEGPGAAGVPPLTADELAAIRQAALARLAAAGVSPQLLARLASAQLRVAPLPPGYLGLAYSASDRVVLDDDAAGHGWFIDPTPLADEEFQAAGPAVPGGTASGRVDLLTVVLHELGHVAGLPDDSGADLMGGALGTGVRHVSDLGAVFGQG
jgi:hypothetical protein